MPLHLLKLCVGAESIADLEKWIAARLLERRRTGDPPQHWHTTRMTPKRKAELLEGGSLYWVIKGQIAARQTLIDIRPFTDSAGIGRTDLVLDNVVTPVALRPQRAFQGWRYLADKDAPPDLATGRGDVADMPEDMRRQLRDLGLL